MTIRSTALQISVDFSAMSITKPKDMDDARWNKQKTDVAFVVKQRILEKLAKRFNTTAEMNYPTECLSSNIIPVTLALRKQDYSIENIRTDFGKKLGSYIRGANSIAFEIEQEQIAAIESLKAAKAAADEAPKPAEQ